MTSPNRTGFFKRRISQPILNLLKQGMTPPKLSLTCAVGTVLGIIPAFGITTVLVTLVAARLKLNIAATILISYLVQPLQLLLLIPFARAGIALFQLEDLQFTLDEILALFQADWLQALHMLWLANLVAVVAWFILAAPIAALLYYSLLPVFRKVIPATSIIRPV
ncbi:DUF2062 domain-containing protein [Pontibacter qinzhouensis]|uniref:DUF2062 domain-containing protein n=1 Tax=Pontibacter qinzhouensis TaxID=2603253 RepID=A0A5C8K5A5_9BACT|nr:DUF2062 domain-containing protein [Pontibacter qinzhouensis]TXK45788.1 DUF2062 domain-containing protein [Pontibacter qinzhouensis]